MANTPKRASNRLAHRIKSGSIWLAVSIIITGLMLLPVLALVVQAFEGSQGLWSHLIATTLPVAFRDTVLLLIGVGLIAATLGTTTAWLVSAYDFPGRRVLEWALLLPLAVPTYIIAYAYLDLLHPIGSVQSAIRAILGYSSPREFRLPDIRSLTGCMFLLGFVLYPYVYIPTRAMFLTQSANLIEAARTLGVSQKGIFWFVALPMARPAVAVGVSLALMEALNDIGAAEFLGVRTLTVSIYTTWITRSDLPGASQIALTLLLIVVLLVSLERWARRKQRFTLSTQRSQSFEPRKVNGIKGWLFLLLGFLPIFFGFLAPAIYLTIEAWKRVQFAGISPRLYDEALNTIILAGTATIITLTFGIVVAYAMRLRPGQTTQWAYRLSTMGYAAPGTVIAIGILIITGNLDRFIDQNMQHYFGVTTGLLLLGSGTALLYAYATRFMAISAGGIEAGLNRIPPSFDHAARTLGHNNTSTFLRIHLPLSRTAMTAAALLVFVDCVKELPATLLLRPLNMETFATHLYGEAARGTYEEASVAALAIVVIGILPVILLSKIGRKI
ncbi:ABC transporter permease [Brucellaceae bacterium C25G]